VELANAGTCQLWGRAEEDVVGRPLFDALPELWDQPFRTLLDEVLQTGRTYTGKETPARLDRRGDGTLETVYLNFVYAPLRGVGGQTEGILVIAFDVTDEVVARNEMSQLRAAAEAASRAKDEFLATLSHELRTPINAILGWGQMLQRGAVSADRTAHALDAIVRNAAAQVRLIEDLLDLSRITSGRLRLDVETVDVASVVSAAVATVEPAAQAKGVRLQTVLDDGGALVYGDRQRLQQAVWNLLSNAVKFTARGGRVHVRVLRINSHLEIVVGDTGQGIAPDVLPYVFDRFRQGAAGSTRPQAGLGLGLAIVRHIVELHGGTVDAASDGPGTGATFSISLPLSVARLPRPPDHDGPDLVHPAVPTIMAGSLDIHALPDLAGTRVLVVENEPDAREMVAYLLRQKHADVTVSASVDEALCCVDERIPDVILSDIEMPGRDGYDLIRTLRARPREQGGEVAAAALTAYSRPEDRARSLLAGFDAHMSKPVDLAELVATVARLRSGRQRGASTGT
jgi:signal transduction histidine kinase/ActR/RegA family two-component response regulator